MAREVRALAFFFSPKVRRSNFGEWRARCVGEQTPFKCYYSVAIYDILGGDETMSRILLGSICGAVFGVLVVAMMLPMEFPDKRAALIGAFLNRFGIGFVIGAANLPLPGWATGMIFGLLLSLPDAIITKAYIPIIVLGVIGGTIIGFVVNRWGV